MMTSGFWANILLDGHDDLMGILMITGPSEFLGLLDFLTPANDGSKMAMGHGKHVLFLGTPILIHPQMSGYLKWLLVLQSHEFPTQLRHTRLVV